MCQFLSIATMQPVLHCIDESGPSSSTVESECIYNSICSSNMDILQSSLVRPSSQHISAIATLFVYFLIVFITFSSPLF